jgi:hypothetical protein
MTSHGLRNDVVVLAGTSEVRIVESTTAAERELASGFRPAVVLLGSEVCGPGAADFARRMGAHPDRATIPVLAVSGSADRIRLTPLNEDLEPPTEPEELCGLLQVLEDLCSEPLRLVG